jgi:class 3 adenylate cyclase
MTVCSHCGTENAATAKFCNECGTPFAATGPREQRKTVSVLFCDVSGSTSLGERVDPEALRAIMVRYFDVARAAIERHGGMVEKFIGDAVMAVFGIPVVHEDDALRAVRAASDLRDAVEIDVRIGVNTGEVVTGGAATLATGDAVNVAARLEQAAGSGEVLLGEQTYALVRDAVDAELLPPLEAKGKSQPLTAYRLRAVTGEPHRRDAAPMVGRARELALLAQAYERTVHEQACHLFTILGTAGIGKSRLVSEFLAQLPAARVVQGRCLSYGEGITYWPVVEVLKQLGTPVESVFREGTTPPEIAWDVRKAFEHAALDGSLVVVFDDIQWGEATFLELIEHVADLSRGAPILLLCMARPELLDVRPGWAGGKHNATSVLLEPLPPEAVDELLRALAGEVDERIREAADGNPLFLEEMVELARVSGDNVAVPPTIQALLTARLDSLPPAERSVLERGAVEGQVFHRGAVAALAPEELQVDTRLVSLVRKELVRPDQPALPRDDAYRFRHLLIRDAAYEALPKATRIELHERFATWLEEHGADLVELDEIVGYHFEQASRYADELGLADSGRAARAAARLVSAARRADARSDAAATLKLGERAERLLDPDDPQRLELLPLLGSALFEQGRLDESETVLTEAVERNAGLASARARVARVNLRGLSGQGTYDWMDAELKLAAAAAADDDATLAGVYRVTALNEYWQGRLRASREAALRALELARSGGAVAEEALALDVFRKVVVRDDTPWEEVEQFASELLENPALGPLNRAGALVTLARCVAARGRFDEARALHDDVTRAFGEFGLHVTAAGTRIHTIETEQLAGDWAAMERAARDTWQRLGELGERGVRSTVGAMFAEALAHLGRLDEAEAVADEAEQIMFPGDFTTEYGVLVARSAIASRRGEHDRAVDLAQESVALIDRFEYHEFRAWGRINLAEVLVAAGRFDDVEALVAAAVALCETKGNLAQAALARAVLATMTA